MCMTIDGGRKLFENTLGSGSGERLAISFCDDNKTYRDYTVHECRRATHAMASRLQGQTKDLPCGTWTGLSMGIHPMWFPALFALLERGFNVLMLSHDFDAERTALCARLGGLKVIVTDKRLDVDGVKTIDFDTLSAEPFEDVPPNPEPWADLVGTCTSGTTGAISKFPVMSASTMMDSFYYTEKSLRGYPPYWEGTCKGNMAGKGAFFSLPLHHAYGNEFALFFSHMGMPIYLCETKSVMRMLEIIREKSLWVSPTVPIVWKTFYQIMLGRFGEATPEAFRTLFGNAFGAGVSAGGTLDPNVRTGFAQVGLTICDFWATSETPQGLMKVLNTRGSNHFDLDMSEYVKKVKLEDGTKADFGTGELMLKDGCECKGYLSEGRLTPLALDEDGYIATGDVFEKRPEGYYFLGRCKNVIIGTDGENVYPEELEMKFEFLTSAAEQYRIVGLDDAPALFVFPGERQSMEELLAHIREINSSLDIYKRVTRVFFARRPMPSGIKGVKAKDLVPNLSAHPADYQEIVLIKKRG